MCYWNRSEVKEEKFKFNMKGKVNKANQTMKSTKKQNQKKSLMKQREIKKLKDKTIKKPKINKMKVLKDRKVKFISAVGLSLLISFWICF